jgi:hypothetical protein
MESKLIAHLFYEVVGRGGGGRGGGRKKGSKNKAKTSQTNRYHLFIIPNM